MSKITIIFGALLLLELGGFNEVMAQSASFNFSQGSQSVSGWTNVAGDPSVAVRNVTAPSGITISSVSTTNWVPFSNCSYDGGGQPGGTFFPAAVMANHWFNYDVRLGNYNAMVPQLIIGGLNIDSVYTLKMTGSFSLGIPANFSLDPISYTVTGAIVYGYVNINGNFNTSEGATFQNIAPDSNGHIKIYVNTLDGSNVASICGIQIISGRTTQVAPSLTMSQPVTGDIIPEDQNVNITVTATESTGSIARVEFYADTSLLGVDSTAPYSFVWVTPDPGKYTIKARAIDGTGNTSIATANIVVESLNYFWSTTGNIATGADSNFIGTVDSNRLAFRTKNIERMTIAALGNVGIGTDSPTAQLHTTGSVRLAGLASDSSNAQPRMLVADTSGKLYYRSLATGGLNPGAGLGGTSTGIAIGDSIPGSGPHNFNSNRYQYLNGFMYSIGGTVNDPVNHPNFRIYNNGDLAAGTTMDRSVNTNDQVGMRYYSKMNYLQIGASDRLDTSRSNIVYGGLPSSAIFLNSDDSNSIHGKFMNSLVAGYTTTMDTNVWCENCLLAIAASHLNSGMGGTYDLVVAGSGLKISAPVNNSFLGGGASWVSKPINANIIEGYGHNNSDTSWYSAVSGSWNIYGGTNQLTAGQFLTNRTPNGTVLGNANVDFSTLPYTGTQDANVANLGSYPIFAVGNSNAYWHSTTTRTITSQSNALTVLYNGRTQINTTGFANNLTQSNVTPQAALDVVSTNTGVLLPRLTTTQRNAIVSADLQNGLLLYNTDSSVFQYYNGTAWNSVGSGTGGSSRWLFAGGTAYDSVDNIAIGTSNPQGYKLAVNGTAIFTKVKVKNAGTWPDYVFKKGYILPGLEELEKYVSEYHHLPGIASEQEVQLHGIDLGDQQAALLKKVEELTLYLIHENRSLTDQNKQLSDQNRQLAEQGARLEAQQKEIDELKAMIQAKK